MAERQQILNYDGPVPPMPRMLASNGNEDFIANVAVYHRAIGAVLDGAPRDMFEWQTDHNVSIGTPYGYHTDELLQRNLRALQRWESVLEARRAAPKAAPRPEVAPGTDNKRNRALGVLRKVEAELSALAPDTSRDNDTNKEIWALGRFVNDGALAAGDVADMVIRASHANGHYPGNKSMTQIESDIDRALADAARDGILPDWDND